MKKKLIKAEDIREIRIPSNLSVSADNSAFVYLLNTPEGDGYANRIMLSQPMDAPAKEVARGIEPVLSPDGKKIAYFRNGMLAVHQISSGEETVLGEFSRPSSLSWFSNSKKLCFTAARILPFEPKDLPKLENAIWIDRLKFKSDGEGMYDGSYRQLMAADITSGEVIQVTSERCDYSNPLFLSENRVTASCIRKDCDNSDFASVVIFDLLTGAEIEYPGPGGPITRMANSHDGRQIALLTHDNSQWEATNFKIYLLDTVSGSLRCCTEQIDRSVGNYASSKAGLHLDGYHFEWSTDDRFVYTLMLNRSCCGIYRLDVLNGEYVQCVEKEGIIYDYALTDNGFNFLMSTVTDIASLVFRSFDGSENLLWRETSFDDTELGTLSEFTFAGHDGTERQAFYMAPLTTMRGVVLDIHGGPHYSYGESFSIDAQLLAANGFGVVFCNPAGSQGYGEKISKASKCDWGGKDYMEIMTCVDTVIAQFGLASMPWGVMGVSYGGFLTNWIIGHTDFFCCAISECSSCNRYSQSGTSDCAYRYGEFEFLGYAWDNPDFYMEHSPITYIRNVKTPLLLIHGESDMNCSISQSEEMYSAMKLCENEVYFARFPGQYHSFATLGSISARIDRYHLLVWWMQRYME